MMKLHQNKIDAKKGGSALIIRRVFYKLTSLSWLILTWSTILLIVFTTILLPVIEPETFTNYLDSFWFTMTTILTVGYGDISPATSAGKIYTILFLYVLGIGLFATFIGKAFDSFGLLRKRREGGDLMFEEKNHIVIIDWSHKAEIAIKEILARDPKRMIVVIDKLEKAKELHDRIHYVRGNATESETLNKANIRHAKAVLIFADDNIGDQMLTDGKSLMIACAVERIAPGVHTTVEVEREEHVENFSHVKIDKFILANGTIAKAAVDSIF